MAEMTECRPRTEIRKKRPRTKTNTGDVTNAASAVASATAEPQAQPMPERSSAPAIAPPAIVETRYAALHVLTDEPTKEPAPLPEKEAPLLTEQKPTNPSAPPDEQSDDSLEILLPDDEIMEAASLARNGVSIGPLKFYPLPQMSVAGLKSTLRSDIAISTVICFATIAAFALVCGKHQMLNIPLAAATRVAVSFAGISVLAAMMSILFGILLHFVYYHKTKESAMLSPRLATAKFGAAATATIASVITSICAYASPDEATGIALLALIAGTISAPAYLAFFCLEAYALLGRPRLFERLGEVPTQDEDTDVCCTGM